MIVAVLSEKGGTRKATLATNLAGMRAAAGSRRQVLLVDADRQGSASYWAEQRRTTARPAVTCLQKFGRALARDLRALAPRYDDVIIDVAAGDSQDLEDVLRVAERVLIPVQPAGLDVWTLGLLDDRVAEAQAVNPSLTAFVVLNRASPNPRDRDTHDAQQAMAACVHLRVAPVVIRERVAIKRAAPAGLSVQEYTPRDAKATAELAQVYQLAFPEKRASHGHSTRDPRPARGYTGQRPRRAAPPQ
jgi:chromosome partitioning protein